MSEENKAMVRRYLSAISGKDKPPAVVNQFVADVDEALKQHIAYFEAAFPRYEMIEEDMIAEKDQVVVRLTARGTHKGEFMGVPATGKSINIPGILIYRIANGKIIEHWMQVDAVSLMQQLGAQG